MAQSIIQLETSYRRNETKLLEIGIIHKQDLVLINCENVILTQIIISSCLTAEDGN